MRLRTKKSYLEISKYIIDQFWYLKNDKSLHIEINNIKSISLARFTIKGEQKKITIRQNIIKLVSVYPEIYNNIINTANVYLNYIIGENSLDNNDALFVFILLHELGHLAFRFVYNNKFGIDLNKLKRMLLIDRLTFATTTNDDKNISIYKDHFSSDEIYANMFAYKNFPRIWYILKNKKYVK